MATRKSSAAAPAAPSLDVLLAQQRCSPVAALTDIGQCWQLPLAPQGEPMGDPGFAPGTIQRFKDTDGTTMVVVSVNGALHKTPA